MSALAARARSLRLLTPPLLLLGAARPTPPKAPPSWFWGCWVVTKDLSTSNVSGLSQRQVNAIMRTRIVFTPTCARSGRTVVKSPKYSVDVQSAPQFFELGYYVPLSQIGVREQHVTEVELDLPDNPSDLDFPGSDVYLRKPDIVIVVEGEYFVGERAKPGDPACKCESAGTK